VFSLNTPGGRAKLIIVPQTAAYGCRGKCDGQERSGAVAMVEYVRKSVASIELVVRTKPQDMRRRQFDFEDELKTIFPSPSKSLDNMPHPPGMVPRWLLADGEKLLIATDQSVGLTLSFQSGRPQKGAISVAERYSRSLDSAVEKIIGKSNIIFGGIVTMVNFVAARGEPEISQDIAKRLLSTKKPLQRIISASATIGYRGEGEAERFNFLYQVAPFKTVNVPTPSVPGSIGNIQPIDVDSYPAVAVGLQIRIDVNDRHSEAPDNLGGTSSPQQGSLLSLIPICRAACGPGLRDLLDDQSLEVDGL